MGSKSLCALVYKPKTDCCSFSVSFCWELFAGRGSPFCRPALHAQAWSSCRNLWTCLWPLSGGRLSCPAERPCSLGVPPLHLRAPLIVVAAEPAPRTSSCSGSFLQGSVETEQQGGQKTENVTFTTRCWTLSTAMVTDIQTGLIRQIWFNCFCGASSNTETNNRVKPFFFISFFNIANKWQQDWLITAVEHLSLTEHKENTRWKKH